MDRKLLFIFNIRDEKEGNGFISKTNAEKKIEELKWITGFTDPKGLLFTDSQRQ